MTRTQKSAALLAAISLGAAVSRRSRRQRAFSFRGRSALITGGSRGLGLLIARRLLEEGADVTIAARDFDELTRAEGMLSGLSGQLTCVVKDIAHREQAEAMVHELVARTGRIDVLINNAGVIKVGPLGHMDHSDFEEAMAVHFWGPLHATLAALPSMQHRHFGRIVNIASVGGQVGVPHLTPYCASKFALVGLSDSIRAEVARDGIYVTTITPGLMRTGSPFNAWFKGRHRDEFAWFAIADSLPGLTVNAERAADIVIDACRHGDANRAIGWTAKLASLANAAAPGVVASVAALTNQFVLPAEDGSGTAPRSGWQSLSRWAPSPLTRLTERAAHDNNEVPGEQHAPDLAH